MTLGESKYMSDLDQMKELKQKYLGLIKTHGKEVTEYKDFRKALLDLNKRCRKDAIQMYSDIIARIEKKLTKQ